MKNFLMLSLVLVLAAGASGLYANSVLAQAGTTNGCSNGAVDGGDGNCYNMDTGNIVGTVQTAPAGAQSPQSGSGFVALAPIPGLTDQSSTSAVNADSLANFFNNLYKYAIGLSAVLAVIMIIWGGLEYATQDSISKKSDGKQRILEAIFGLVLVLSPALVFSIINPKMLNLSIGLEKLNLGTAPSGQQQQQPYIQQSVRPGSLNAVNNNTLIGFQEGLYPSVQSKTYCYTLANEVQNIDRSINNGRPYTATVACSRTSNGCRMFMNSGEWPPAEGATCSLIP